MSNKYFRFLSIIALVAVLGISLTQYIWFRKAYQLKETSFSQNVHMALREVAVTLLRFNQNNSPIVNPVFQEASNYFVVRIDDEINADLLEELLIREFKKRKIELDFEYGIYDCTTNRIRYGNYVGINESKLAEKSTEFPNIYHENNYFAVRFPQKSAALIAELGSVLIASGLSILVILFFILSLYVIFKQKKLSEIQRDFVNNMTHEFKTPISSIAIAAEVLKKNDISLQPHRIQSYATIIFKEAMRLQNQVERILQSSREEKSQLKLTKEGITIQDFLNEIAESPAWLEKKFDIQIDMPSQPILLFLDTFHVANVMHNLLENSQKYGPDQLSINITVKHDKKCLTILFTDNGPGIPEVYRKKVFTKFFRVPSGMLHDNKGFGLGLYYVRQVMLAHKGDVKCISGQDEKGCCIALTFNLSAN